MKQSVLASGRIRLCEGDGWLEFRTMPISIPSGLVMLAFALGFISLAVFGTPEPVGESLSPTSMIVLALALLGGVVWVLAYQRLVLSAAGVVMTRSLFGLPMRRRRFPLAEVGRARSLFSHGGGDENPDTYVLEIQVSPKPIRFSNECTEAELKDLAERFNALRKVLVRHARST